MLRLYSNTRSSCWRPLQWSLWSVHVSSLCCMWPVPLSRLTELAWCLAYLEEVEQRLARYGPFPSLMPPRSQHQGPGVARHSLSLLLLFLLLPPLTCCLNEMFFLLQRSVIILSDSSYGSYRRVFLLVEFSAFFRHQVTTCYDMLVVS